jgi:hypothetical protein
MGDARLEPLVLSEDERRTLENRVKRRSTATNLDLPGWPLGTYQDAVLLFDDGRRRAWCR